ncbi:nitronate monooxygenase [bacterium]|nr:nitronate monooxygenase [bacterium]
MKLSDFSFKLGQREFLPLLQGGMGVNISTAALALEMARLGAIGHISDALSPYLSDRMFKTTYHKDKSIQFKDRVDDFPKPGVKWDEAKVYEASKNYCRDTMSKVKGSGGVFINVMEKLGMGAPAETLRARLQGAMDGGIDGITLSAGLHTGSLQLVTDHPRFRDVLFGIIVSSARALKIFLRSAQRAERLPDYIIVEGPLAGGHLGFGMDWHKFDLRTIVQDVLHFLKENGLKIPVIPAGGIFTGADAVSYLQQGAEAVQVATRFTISRECGLPEATKQIYLKSREEDVVVNLISPTGYPMRMLVSSPSMRSNIKPQCEPLGYILDAEGKCQYHDAYAQTGFDSNGKKLPVTNKMCICHHFMKYDCYTCGHNVFKLKDTTTTQADGSYVLPSAEQVATDYLHTACELHNLEEALAAVA